MDDRRERILKIVSDVAPDWVSTPYVTRLMPANASETSVRRTLEVMAAEGQLAKVEAKAVMPLHKVRGFCYSVAGRKPRGAVSGETVL